MSEIVKTKPADGGNGALLSGDKATSGKWSNVTYRVFIALLVLALFLFDRKLSSFTWSEIFAIAAFVASVLIARRNRWFWFLYGIGFGALIGALLDLIKRSVFH
jgi:hypothetical protein